MDDLDFLEVELLELLLDEVFLEVGFDEEVSLELEVSSLVSTSITIFFTDLDELDGLDFDELELDELELDDLELELELGELEELETFGVFTFTLAGFCFLLNLTIFPNVLKVNLLFFFFSSTKDINVILVFEDDDDEDEDDDEIEEDEDDEDDDDEDFGFDIFTSMSTLESLEELELDFLLLLEELGLFDFSLRTTLSTLIFGSLLELVLLSELLENFFEEEIEGAESLVCV